MSLKASRNDPCPCGSNKKYKNCCGKKGFRLDATLFKRIFLTVLLMAAAGWAGNRYLFAPDQDEPFVSPFTTQQADRVQPLTPRPPGPAPEGKVWSAEHGHWHETGTVNPDGEGKIYPQPEGLVPPGKIWSAEHGHWHDSSGTATGSENLQPGPPPPGPAPEGKTWAYDHGHWHDAPKSGTENTKPSSPPPGPTPEGKVWSADHGHWHDSSYDGTDDLAPGSPPPGPAPEGKVWSSDHGHWHNAPTANMFDTKKITPGSVPEKIKISTSDKKGE